MKKLKIIGIGVMLVLVGCGQSVVERPDEDIEIEKSNEEISFQEKQHADYPENFKILNNNYAKGDRKIYYWNTIIKEADFKTFEVLDNNYAKDKNYIYYKNKKIEEADSNTFQLLGMFYAKDNKNVYYCNEKVINADVNSFEVISEKYNYSKDKNYIYKETKKLETVDPKTFEVLDYYYSKDKNYVYFYDQNWEEVDTETFKVLDFVYVKDKTNCYKSGWKSMPVNGVYQHKIGIKTDMSECDKIEQNSKNEKTINVDLSNKKDELVSLVEEENNEGRKNKLFVFNGVSDIPFIQAGDCANIDNLFEIGDIDEDGDTELGMFNATCTSRSKSLKVISLIDNEWKEISEVYFDTNYNEPPYQERVEKIEKNKFRVLEKYGDWEKSDDGDMIEKLVERYRYFSFDGNDVKEFIDLGNGYLKDEKFVYYVGVSGTEKVKEADLETFESLEYFFAKDKNGIFFKGHKVLVDNVDIPSFQPIDINFTKDKNNCYKNRKIVQMYECEKAEKESPYLHY